MRTLLLVTIFLALGLPASAADDHRDFEDETLPGLDAVAVLVKTEGAEQLKVTPATLQGEIVTRLQRAGLSAVPFEKALKDSVRGVMNIYLGVTGTPEMLVFETKVDLLQSVVLVRDPSISTLAPTWTRTGRGYGSPSAARDKLNLQIEQFVSSWQSKNPRKP